jgi:hypothetical protein
MGKRAYRNVSKKCCSAVEKIARLNRLVREHLQPAEVVVDEEEEVFPMLDDVDLHVDMDIQEPPPAFSTTLPLRH